MSESYFYVELKFPKRDLMDILIKENKELLWKLVLEAVHDLMGEHQCCEGEYVG